MLIFCVFLLIVLAALSYITWNLVKKVEIYEDDILLKDEFISKFKTMVEESDKQIRLLDNSGHFESDDEIGYFFKIVKDINFTMDVYFKNYIK